MCIWKNKVTNHNLLHFIQISFRTSTKSTEKNIVSSNALKLFQLSNFTTGRRLFFTNDKVNCFIRNTPLPPSGKHDPALYTYIHTAQTGAHSASIKSKKQKRQSMKLPATVFLTYLFRSQQYQILLSLSKSWLLGTFPHICQLGRLIGCNTGIHNLLYLAVHYFI